MSQPETHVLVIGGESPPAPALAEAFEPETRFRFARRADEAAKMLTAQPADFALVDLEAARAESFNFLDRLRENPPVPGPLVLALAAPGDTEGKLRAYELGVLDCADKPLEPRLFRARMQALLRSKRKCDELLREQRELLNARLAAEANARVKSEFLSAMSHEIRTPMNGVIAMTGLLMETPLTPEQRGYLETIHTSGESLLAIINDILDFSKIEAGRMELDVREFDLRARLEETLDVLAAKAAEKNLDLVYQCDAALPQTIVGDPLRLRQVLVNLLSNAVKFTQQGDVLLQVQSLPLPSLPAETSGDMSLNLHFSVRDSGVGIPAETLARLFQPFMQAAASTARHYGGTGLGLAICKRLVELMGGKMWAESTPGEGSTFHFTLPVRAKAPATPPALAGRQPKLAGLRILIVEDSAAARHALAAQVTQWGMMPSVAENAARALEQLRADEPFDLAIVDAELPDIDGPALAREIHQLPRAAMLPLVFLTSLGAHTDASETHVAFAQSTSKPVKPAPLFAAIEQALFSSKKAEAAPCAPTNGADQPFAERIPWRILLVDDNAINQKVAARILQQLGYRPDLAGTGREALAAQARQPYDLVFMDVMMPEMDGFEATRALREQEKNAAARPPHVPRTLVIAMTAHALPSDREKCLAAGMDDYLAKPIRPNDVRAIIEKWVVQTRATAPPPASKPEKPVAPAAQTAMVRTPRPSGASPAPAASAVSAPTGGPPVELSRLTDLTDGNPESLRELLEMFYRQTGQQLAQIENAVRAGNAAEAGRVAHSCKGASATLGMARLAAALLQLEKLGKSGALAGAEPLCAAARSEFVEIQNFLSAQPFLAGTPPAAVQP